MANSPSQLSEARQRLVDEIRVSCGIPPEAGPSDRDISEAIDGFAGQFDYWFDRVIANAVRDYRKLIIARINPFVRGIEFQGRSPQQVAQGLVRDYTNRNFVTAGGWAIEKMAIALGSKNAKAAATGIDLHKIDPATGAQHLYVIKSGTVTRNSDILSQLKRNAEAARRLLVQGGAKVSVFASYAVAAGATTSTYADNIYRPSSAQFWAEVTELDEDQALRLSYAISRAASDVIRRGSDRHVRAMELLVERYVQVPGAEDQVDWNFLFDRTMKEKKSWSGEDLARHKLAWEALLATGYIPSKGKASASVDAVLEPLPGEEIAE